MVKQSFQQMVDDNVQFVELRSTLGPVSWKGAVIQSRGGGGISAYNDEYRYVRPLRPNDDFHALPAVPKHIFFIARRSKALIFFTDQPVPMPIRSWNPQFSRPPFHVKSQFP